MKRLDASLNKAKDGRSLIVHAISALHKDNVGQAKEDFVNALNYYKKKNSNVDDWDVYAILEKMFDEEGEDLVKISDEKLQAMQDFYKDVER